MSIDTQESAVASARGGPRLRRIDELPGPRGLPVLGNILDVKPDTFHLTLEAWCRKFGPAYRVKLGKRHMVVMSDHELIASMLRNRPDGFRRTARLHEIGREIGLKPGVFGAEGDAWRRQRRMVMAGFDPAHVKGYYPALLKVGQRLAGRWERAAAATVSIDIQADLMRFTVDTIAGLAFGSEVNTLESDHDVIQQHLDNIFPAIARRTIAPFPIWRYVKSKADRELERSMTEVNRAVDGFVAQARARLAAEPALREHPSNLLEAMIAAADAPDSGIDDDQVAGNVLTMLLAGEDTTANTVAWMIDLLWRNPEALKRAIDEVRRVAGDCRSPSMEQINSLDFIEACAHETMRLKPVAPLILGQALKDTVVGDIEIPAGTVIIGLLRHDSVSEQHIAHASVFDPDRWLAGAGTTEKAKSAKRIAMPFGAGPRICPGRYLALLEMKMAMAILLGRFDIESVNTPDGGPTKEKLSFTLTPVGLSMRLKVRSY